MNLVSTYFENIGLVVGGKEVGKEVGENELKNWCGDVGN